MKLAPMKVGHPAPVDHPWHEQTRRNAHHKKPRNRHFPTRVYEERAEFGRLDPIEGCAPCLNCGSPNRVFTIDGECHCRRCGCPDPTIFRSHITHLGEPS